jgi:hypothetical protein
MPSEVATPRSAVEQSVLSSAGNSSSSGNGASETFISNPPGASESFSTENNSEGGGSRSDAGQRELSLQDFDSLEDYAQALIEKKQSAVSAQQSADDRQGQERGEQENSGQAAEEQVEVEQAEDQQAQDQQAETRLEADDVFSPDVFSPKDLNERINANPALRQALEADPALRNAVFRNARLAGETSKYKEVFPDVESAQYAAQSAARFREVDELFLNATTPEGTSRFLQKWAEMAVLTDEQGNPIMDRGVPQLHPAFTSLLDNMRNNELEFLRQTAERNGDQELMAALDVVRERSSPASRAQDNELPPHIRAAAEQIRARESELNRRQLEQQSAEQARFNTVVGEEATQKIDALIEPALNKAALSDFVRQTAREKIDNAIVESLGRNRFFQARMSELARYPLTPQTRQQRLNLIMSHVQAIAGPVVRQVLREASQPVMRAQEERRSRIDAQVARSRSEPKGATSASVTGKSQAPEQLFEQIRNDYSSQHGEEPSAQKLIELWALARKQR